MKIATVPSKRRKDLIIIAILLIGLPIVVFASYQIYHLVIRASVEAQPKNVTISNLTTSSVAISWVTEVNARGSVIPVVNTQEQSPVIDKRGSGRRKTHYVELSGLEPNTRYEFVIVSESIKYSGEGEKSFVFRTAPVMGQNPSPTPGYGPVKGVSADDVLVFGMLKDRSTYPVSAVMPKGGNWLLDISALRNVSDHSLVNITPNTNMVLVAVTGPDEGAKIEGTFSELFDSNGKLKDVHAFNVEGNTTLYESFSPASMLGVHIDEFADIPTEPERPPFEDPPQREREDEGDDMFDDRFSSGDTYSDGTTTPLEEDTEDIEFERRYGVVHDIDWVDMVSAGEVVSTETGESSIQILNLTDTGFTVVWVSEEKEQGYISYGTSPTSLSLDANDERDGITTRNSYYVHIVSLRRLQPEVEYFFEINSGNQTYDNSGEKYRVTTHPTLSSPPPLESISGQIVEGLPEHGEAVLIAQIKDGDDAGSQGESSPIVTTVDENGRWILSIADSRTQDGLSYFEYTSGDKIYIDVLTTFPTKTHQERIQGISRRDIEISLEAVETTRQTKVDFLDSYGVLGVSIIRPQSNDSVLGVEDQPATEELDRTYSVVQGTQTPKTGIFDSYPLLFLSASTLVVLLSLVYISKVTKKSKKGKMRNNI